MNNTTKATSKAKSFRKMRLVPFDKDVDEVPEPAANLTFDVALPTPAASPKVISVTHPTKVATLKKTPHSVHRQGGGGKVRTVSGKVGMKERAKAKVKIARGHVLRVY